MAVISVLIMKANEIFDFYHFETSSFLKKNNQNTEKEECTK